MMSSRKFIKNSKYHITMNILYLDNLKLISHEIFDETYYKKYIIL